MFLRTFNCFALCFLLLLIVLGACQPAIAGGDSASESKTTEKRATKGRPPVIIIPGLVGSELLNPKNATTVWFSTTRAKDDDLRLPISPDIKNNRDNLVPGDILRTVRISRLLPGIRIYQSLIESLLKDGYKEASIDYPTATGSEDTFYVFPFDWRRDNVENAHLLLQKLDNIRAKSNRPNLKFDVVAHSMGGMIARYAAMHGLTDLSDKMGGNKWKGENYFNNISLVGTPNGGSVLVLDALINGMSLSGGFKVNVPFVMDLSKFDAFTVPSIYQLLPHEGLLRVYDEDLNRIELDIYDVATWEKYGWLAYESKGFKDEFSPKERAFAKDYFKIVLHRGKLFQAALNARSSKTTSVRFYNIVAECKSTIDGMIVYKDQKTGNWRTLFKAESFKKSDGNTVSKKGVKAAIVSKGDGQVSDVSALHSFTKANDPKSTINRVSTVCGHHSLLLENKEVRKHLLEIFKLPAGVRFSR